MNTLDLSEGFLSPETLAALRVSSDSKLISALLTSNINNRDVVAVVVDNIYTNGIHLLLIAKKYKQDIAIATKIIEHWNASREVFDCLATSTSSKVRAMVAKNPKLSPSMVKILLSDTSQTVKDALNFNPNLPQANKNAALNMFADYEGLKSTILSPSPESKKMQKMRIELKNYGIDTADRSVILGALSQDPDFLGLKFEIRDYSEGPCLRITWEHIVLRKVGAYTFPGENGEVMVGNPLASRDMDFCGHISGKVARAIL